MISGRLLMHTKDGDQTYEAGQAFSWAPGHAPEALEDCEYIDISPSERARGGRASPAGGRRGLTHAARP